MSTATARSTSPRTQNLTVQISRQLVDSTAKILHGAFPQISVAQQASTKYFATFVSAVGLLGILFLLVINTLLAQDAFTLSNLKLEAKTVADQRDAITRKIDQHATPDALASAATALGMKQSDTPIFLNLSPEEVARG
jgi:hypothetical protein